MHPTAATINLLVTHHLGNSPSTLRPLSIIWPWLQWEQQFHNFAHLKKLKSLIFARTSDKTRALENHQTWHAQWPSENWFSTFTKCNKTQMKINKNDDLIHRKRQSCKYFQGPMTKTKLVGVRLASYQNVGLPTISPWLQWDARFLHVAHLKMTQEIIKCLILAKKIIENWNHKISLFCFLASHQNRASKTCIIDCILLL